MSQSVEQLVSMPSRVESIMSFHISIRVRCNLYLLEKFLMWQTWFLLLAACLLCFVVMMSTVSSQCLPFCPDFHLSWLEFMICLAFYLFVLIWTFFLKSLLGLKYSCPFQKGPILHKRNFVCCLWWQEQDVFLKEKGHQKCSKQRRPLAQ